MAQRRDVAAFDKRAAGYERGWLGKLHHEIANRAAALVLAETEAPNQILDVGCGTGYLLRLLASYYPAAAELAGVDPAPGMIEVAREAAGIDRRIHISVGFVEHLEYPDGVFDLVVSTTSFDHWSDQRAGLAECARVMRRGGCLVLVDQFSRLLAPSLLTSGRGKARTKRRANRLLATCGFESLEWHELYAVIIKVVTARK